MAKQIVVNSAKSSESIAPKDRWWRTVGFSLEKSTTSRSIRNNQRRGCLPDLLFRSKRRSRSTSGWGCSIGFLNRICSMLLLISHRFLVWVFQRSKVKFLKDDDIYLFLYIFCFLVCNYLYKRKINHKKTLFLVYLYFFKKTKKVEKIKMRSNDDDIFFLFVLFLCFLLSIYIFYFSSFPLLFPSLYLSSFGSTKTNKQMNKRNT